MTRRAATGAGLAGSCWSLVALAAVALAASGCRCSDKSGPRPGASASAAPSASVALPAPVASGFPDAPYVSSIVNPDSAPAYAGPSGTVVGRVVVTGDPPLELPDVLKQIPPECSAAKATYGRLFREGPARELADVLVAVTGYKGYVPERDAAQRLEAKGCSFGTRTMALTFGQRIEVVSKDAESYVPELLGERGQPQLVATPGGKAVATLYPTKVGRFALIDNLKLFMTSEVLVLKYATHDVTGLDGRFAIGDVPAGPVVVSAIHPAMGPVPGRPVVVEPGKPTEEIVFEFRFDKAEYEARRADAGAPRADGGTNDERHEDAGAPRADGGAPRVGGSATAPSGKR
jgi:hypothetical protein